jgi:hypothetical protein
MLKNFQRYFRFYLASFLFGLLLVGMRWQAAPLGASPEKNEGAAANTPMADQGRADAGAVAVQ